MSSSRQDIEMALTITTLNDALNFLPVTSNAQLINSCNYLKPTYPMSKKKAKRLDKQRVAGYLVSY